LLAILSLRKKEQLLLIKLFIEDVMKIFKTLSVIFALGCFVFGVATAEAVEIDKGWSYKGWRQFHPHQGNNIISSMGTQHFFAPADPVALKITKLPSIPSVTKLQKPIAITKTDNIIPPNPDPDILSNSVAANLAPIVAEEKKDTNNMKMSYSLGKDTDKDGVVDEEDLCLNTPKVDMVNKQGCWVLGKIYFLFGKSDIQARFTSKLDTMIAYLVAHPEYKIELGGHTDNVGENSINRKLSKKRALAVMRYFLKKGIALNRMLKAGYGFSRPDTDNSTVIKRYFNRRVEVHPYKAARNK
jgi:outer membrane protein OmpA-like peptidoglycan-associated protein